MSPAIEIAIETVFIANISNCIWLNNKIQSISLPLQMYHLTWEWRGKYWAEESESSIGNWVRPTLPPVWRLDHHAIHTEEEEEEEEEDNNNEEEEVRPNTTPPTSLQMVKPWEETFFPFHHHDQLYNWYKQQISPLFFQQTKKQEHSISFKSSIVKWRYRSFFFFNSVGK